MLLVEAGKLDDIITVTVLCKEPWDLKNEDLISETKNEKETETI